MIPDSVFSQLFLLHFRVETACVCIKKLIWLLFAQKQGNIHTLPALSVETLAELYHSCSAVFHPTPYSAWGGAARAALICQKPLVALESPALSALVGPAAYLVPPKQATSSRALGAALITVVIEESVGEELAQAARKLTTRWNGEQFANELAGIYQPYN